MSQQTNQNKSGFLGGVLTAFLAILLIYIVQQKTSDLDQKQLLEEQAKQLQELQKKLDEIPKIPEEKIAFPDYFVALKEMKNITPISDQRGYVKKTTQEIVGSQEIILTGSGRIARGYLYVEASVDNGRPLTIYDSVYIKLNLVGGHLLRNKSLSVPTASGTALLYPLNSIPYLANIPYDETRIGRLADWVAIFNQTKTPALLSFISTNRDGGVIRKITISYECEKETPNCALNILK